MKQNEFEKQIKDQFQNWTMSPSPMVWQRIEQKLHKPDGEYMWWRALAATLIIAVLGVGIWYWVNQNKKGTVAQQQKPVQQTNSTHKQTVQNGITTENINNNKANDIAKTNNDVEKTLQKTNINNQVRQNFNTETVTNTKEKIKHNKTLTSKNTNNYFASNNKVNNNKKDEQKTNSDLIHNEVSSVDRIEKNINNNNKSPLTTADIANIKVTSLNSTLTGNITDITIKLPTKRTIDWSIYTDNGASWTSDIANSPVPARFFEGQQIPVSQSEQASQKAAYTYRFGANISIPIFKRWAITTGVGYTSLSNQILLGNQVNYQFASYYRSGNDNNYTTQNLFIEIPLSIGFQISRAKQLPIWATAGISMLNQIESRNISYDINGRNFSKDNNLTQHTQWQLNFSTNTTLFSSKQLALKIGPYYQFGLGNMYKESAEQFPKRWQSLGLRLKFDFGGKK